MTNCRRDTMLHSVFCCLGYSFCLKLAVYSSFPHATQLCCFHSTLLSSSLANKINDYGIDHKGNHLGFDVFHVVPQRHHFTGIISLVLV